MKHKIKDATILGVIQVVLYSLLCMNFRAIAETQYNLAAITDFAIASMNFFVIRKISKGDDALHKWIGYVIGSVIGSYTGIYISSLLH